MRTPEELEAAIREIKDRSTAYVLRDMVEVNTNLATSLAYQGEVLAALTQNAIAFLGTLGIINPQPPADRSAPREQE